jgi:glycosyltransferase involved in cell wall biosynthesis
MNILILNWRDIKNPKAGGAEILTHEIAKYWVKKGNQVTIFSSYFLNAPKEEQIDGVKFVRKGHPDTRYLFSSVHFKAFLYYRTHSDNFDVVVDEIHGIPFFTPWYINKKKIVLICEVASDLWATMLGPFFGAIGRLMERFYMRFVYKNISYLTISDSTKKELIREGVDPKKIIVLPMGVTIPKKIKKNVKEKRPTVIFVGRFARSKGIEDAIIMLSKMPKKYNTTRLWLVGAGSSDYLEHLKGMVKARSLSDRVTFFGFVSETKKFELMGKAHVLVVPSVKEGWGLIVPEAAFLGTPSVVYDSPGLRDVLGRSNYKTIVKKNTPDGLVEEVVKLLEARIYCEYKKLNAQDYSWDNTGEAALQAIS